VVLYKVVNGKRIDLPLKGSGRMREESRGSQEPLEPDGRHGPRPSFVVSLNGQGLYEVEDVTFTGAGKVGLWTKADSVA
jgi:hypothetical protein